MNMLAKTRNNRQIAIWLLTVCALIFCMVVLGGVTRLTRSGLSMVEWDPIMGVIPPLNETEWQASFDKYKQYPEYRHYNQDMSLGEFKGIFYFEYGHRVLGRLIGMAFLLGFLYFLFTRKLRRDMIPALMIMFVLGGMQGLLGWFMVKSGLVDRPHVSQYRLTAHLSAAIAIYSYIFWYAMGLLKQEQSMFRLQPTTSLRNYGRYITILVFVMILSGGFVAGTRAGFTFNTFPTMNGYWLPPGIMDMKPWYMNFFENITTIQFTHRVMALVVFISIMIYWLRSLGQNMHDTTRFGFHLLLVMLLIQVGLGISTLLLAVPVLLAAAHQAGALLLFTIALYLNHELRRR
jgi:cytochrome c oxidase assembly protein subunit 15